MLRFDIPIPGPLLEQQEDGDDIDNQHDQVSPPEIIEDGQNGCDCQEVQRGKSGESISFTQEKEKFQQDVGDAKEQERHAPLEDGIILKRRMGMQRNDQAGCQPDQCI